MGLGGEPKPPLNWSSVTPNYTLNICPYAHGEVQYSPSMKEYFLCSRMRPLQKTTTNRNSELWSPGPTNTSVSHFVTAQGLRTRLGMMDRDGWSKKHTQHEGRSKFRPCICSGDLAYQHQPFLCYLCRTVLLVICLSLPHSFLDLRLVHRSICTK